MLSEYFQIIILLLAPLSSFNIFLALDIMNVVLKPGS